MTPDSTPIGTDSTADKTFPPPPGFAAQAHASDPEIYARAAENPEEFWAEQARVLDWIRPFDTILEWNPPHAKWFLGGKLNVSANCIDRHIAAGQGEQRGDCLGRRTRGDERVLTFSELGAETQKFANVLKSLGVGKGDRVTLYLPMVPEAAVAMLACTRIGAIHSVVFGGFSAESLAERTQDCGSKSLSRRTATGGAATLFH